MDWYYALLEFYVSLVSYTILHMIFVISGDFVEAFNIPPLNIGIYADKLAAIRALLMVIADILEWGITQQACGDGSTQQQGLLALWKRDKGQYEGAGRGARRTGSILSFIVMLVCRIVYLILVYNSDNKSLSVFITLCVEGFWFGTFQMGFFAIGPEYNAYTSLGIHTMGNFIFFFQLILQRRAKSKPHINPLYRVRVHAWICFITSVVALGLWLYFCLDVTAKGEDAPNQWPREEDVWSPLLLFIIGAFAEDFSVPGILPFAFLDPEKANLVNYFTPVFFMTGALVVVFVNDWIKDQSKFKDWSASTNADEGKWWHGMWSLNIPKYIAFFLAMWSIHGTFGSLRCFIQSRWRVMLLTMFVVIPRSTLEVMGYVGVANWAIGRADFTLGSLAPKLRTHITSSSLSDTTLMQAINGAKGEIATLISQEFGGANPEDNINAVTQVGSATANNLKVELSGTGIQGGSHEVPVPGLTAANGVKVTITIDGGSIGSLNPSGGNNTEAAEVIVKRLVKAIRAAPKSEGAKQDFEAFTYIAIHDMLAMFCRFVYGKFAVGYNWTRVSLIDLYIDIVSY